MIVRRVSLSLSLFVYVSRILSARAVAGDRAPSALQPIPWLQPNHSTNHTSQRIGTRKRFWRIRRRRRRRSSAPRSARPRRRRRAGARRGSALCYLRTIERPIRGAARARGPLCDPEASSLRLPPRSLTDCQEMDQRRVAEPGFALTLSDCPKRGFLTVVWHVRTDPMPSLTSQEAHVPALHW